MRILPVFFGLMLLAAPAWAQDCKLEQADSLPLGNVGSILTVDAILDGAPATLAFDLGGDFIPKNHLYKSYVDAHKFDLQRSNIGGYDIVRSSSEMGLFTANIHQFSLGAVKGANVEFLVEPMNAPSPALAGSLLQTVLANFDFELDMQGKKLNLFLQNHCPGQVVYWPTNAIARLPYLTTNEFDGRFQMTLNGELVRVLLSPNIPTSMIGSKTLHRIFGIDLDSPGVERLASSSDKNPLYTYRFASLVLGDITIRNLNVLIYDQKDRDPHAIIYNQRGDECLDKPHEGIVSRIASQQAPACFGGYDLQLGASIMRQLRFFFSNKEHMLYVTPAAAH